MTRKPGDDITVEHNFTALVNHLRRASMPHGSSIRPSVPPDRQPEIAPETTPEKMMPEKMMPEKMTQLADWLAGKKRPR